MIHHITTGLDNKAVLRAGGRRQLDDDDDDDDDDDNNNDNNMICIYQETIDTIVLNYLDYT